MGTYTRAYLAKSMDKWSQISDDTVVVMEDRVLWFDCPRGEYSLVLKQSSPEIITVRFGDKEEAWPIMTKAIKGLEYKLSGLADWVPEILAEVCWFELEIGVQCTITYWGDQVINRIDAVKA